MMFIKIESASKFMRTSGHKWQKHCCLHEDSSDNFVPNFVDKLSLKGSICGQDQEILFNFFQSHSHFVESGIQIWDAFDPRLSYLEC